MAAGAGGALDKLLGAWDWYLRAEVEVQPSRIVVLAVITVACSSEVRRDIFVCIPSRVNGFAVETRPKNAAACARRVSAAREPGLVPRDGAEGEP